MVIISNLKPITFSQFNHTKSIKKPSHIHTLFLFLLSCWSFFIFYYFTWAFVSAGLLWAVAEALDPDDEDELILLILEIHLHFFLQAP